MNINVTYVKPFFPLLISLFNSPLFNRIYDAMHMIGKHL